MPELIAGTSIPVVQAEAFFRAGELPEGLRAPSNCQVEEDGAAGTPVLNLTAQPSTFCTSSPSESPEHDGQPFPGNKGRDSSGDGNSARAQFAKLVQGAYSCCQAGGLHGRIKAVRHLGKDFCWPILETFRSTNISASRGTQGAAAKHTRECCKCWLLAAEPNTACRIGQYFANLPMHSHCFKSSW